MPIRFVRQALVAGCALLMLTGCASGQKPEGTWDANSPDPKPSLSLENGGQLSGTDGCNRLTGSWKINGSTVEFGQVASTRMFCQGVDDWLSRLHTASIDGDTMTVLDASGATLGTLKRQPSA